MCKQGSPHLVEVSHNLQRPCLTALPARCCDAVMTVVVSCDVYLSGVDGLEQDCRVSPLSEGYQLLVELEYPLVLERGGREGGE